MSLFVSFMTGFNGFLAGAIFWELIKLVRTKLRNRKQANSKDVNVLSSGIVLPEVTDPRWEATGRHCFHLNDFTISLEYEACLSKSTWIVKFKNRPLEELYREMNKYGEALYAVFEEKRITALKSEIQKSLTAEDD